jgi:sodium/bile acid cotransporter 7
VLNSTLSTFLGVVLTPLWVSLMAQGGGHHMDFAHTMANIAQLLLLPFVAGQVLRPWAGAWFARIKAVTGVIDRLIILMLVWTTFSDSVAGGLWTRNGPAVLGVALVGAAMFLLPMLTFSRWAARRLGFDTEDEITAVMCGSKKSMASGVPMAKLLFGSHAALGLVVLPLLIYHQMQLFVCTWLARRYARRLPASS